MGAPGLTVVQCGSPTSMGGLKRVKIHITSLSIFFTPNPRMSFVHFFYTKSDDLISQLWVNTLRGFEEEALFMVTWMGSSYVIHRTKRRVLFLRGCKTSSISQSSLEREVSGSRRSAPARVFLYPLSLEPSNNAFKKGKLS